MANDRPGGDWRHSTGGTTPPARSAGSNTSRRSWQPGGPQSPTSTGKARSRGFRLLVAGALTGLLAALIIVVIWLFWPARYPELVLVGAMSSDSLALPENVAGVNAASDISGWAAEGHDRDRPKLDANPVVSVDAAGAKIAIDPNPKNLVIYITAHGGADANGPYLLMAPPDARSAADAQKVRVRDILDRIAESRRGKATLLIFDATRVTVSWPHGMLFNDFARALKELDAQIDAIPGLAVICASDDDQRSWVFEERRVSVFGFYLLEAMRGAGHDRGQRVTAASAFTHMKAEVERWTIANRGEKQTPILLPQANGQARAEKIDLAAAPASGYQNPTQIETPGNVPPELESAWKTANELATQVPPPEANNPAKWREYLDLLVRYERLFRLGANTNTVRDRVAALATQLRNPSIGREPACLPTAIPTARALGRPSPFSDAKALETFRSAFRAKVWGAANTTERGDAWAALLRTYPGQETAIRTAAANLVIAQLLQDDPTPANLATADAVLATTHGAAGLPAPAEAHFVRMLHLHLDKTKRPDPALLKQAIVLRNEAEEAAWLFTDQSKEYPYSEVVFPWVRGRIESADHNRQLGQDLLFSTDPKAWAEAGKLFQAAHNDYVRACTDGRKVTAALATRDKLFARLPYYARWLAAYRGTRAQDDVDRLRDHAEDAARYAHHLAETTGQDPIFVLFRSNGGGPSVDPLGDHIAGLDMLRAIAEGHFKAVTDAFDTDVAGLTNTPQPSIWHALDGALTVPFIPARRRAELLGYLRHVSYELEVNRQQPDGSQVPPPRTQEAAFRNGKMALAILNETAPDRRQLIERPDPHAWWISFRAGGDQIGERFRGLAKEAKDEADKATRTQTLKEAGTPLAAAALRGRLADPAAPLTGPDPVAADQRFRRHSFLLWQAQRVRNEGWADVARTTPDGWYCRKVAAILVSSVETLIREDATELTGRPSENMSPGELDRWLADCREEARQRPVELTLNADPAREVADEPSWEFSFKLTAAEKDKGAVGFPVSWFDVPPPPYPQADPLTLGRRVEADFSQGRVLATRPLRFIAGPPRDVTGSKPLTSTVLYRGHLYQRPTEVTLVGTPTREVVYTPPAPKNAACFSIRADTAAVGGAVTILIDLTESMNYHLDRNDDTTPTRIQEAKKGLKPVLAQLPNGTKVTIAYFYGDRERTTSTVKPYGKSIELDGTNSDRVFNLFKDAKADGGSTPLAGAIREVLKDSDKKFWPEDFTGVRTLIVLTDGEDNWTRLYDGPKQREAGDVALKALQETPDDVNLHIVFFGLTSKEDKDEEKRAMAQFERLGRIENFRDPPRTPAQLWTGIRDAGALVDLCQRAMLPQFPYTDRKQVTRRQEAMLAQEPVARPTIGLVPGIYDIWGLRGPQAVQLRPADRVLFDASRRGDKFELSIPAYGFEMAKKANRPRAITEGAATNGVYGTIPDLKFVNGSNYADLSLAMTLELAGERRAANVLEVSRPKFVWFDVNYEDGNPAEPGLNPCLRVENRWPLWAPAWNLKVQRWEPAGTDLKKARHPEVKAYWLDGFPVPAANYPIHMNDLTGSWERLQKSLTVRVRESEVTLLSISREKFSGAGLPEGEYLTVRMKYGKPGELVYLRPGNLKGTEQPYELYERHVYYDAQMRYTVRFGPIFDTDPNKDITLDLYSVADLKEASERALRTVTVRLPAGPLKSFDLPPELDVPPRDK